MECDACKKKERKKERKKAGVLWPINPYVLFHAKSCLFFQRAVRAAVS